MGEICFPLSAPGEIAAQHVEADLRARLSQQQSVQILLAAASSQAEILAELIRQRVMASATKKCSPLTRHAVDAYKGLFLYI